MWTILEVGMWLGIVSSAIAFVSIAVCMQLSGITLCDKEWPVRRRKIRVHAKTLCHTILVIPFRVFHSLGDKTRLSIMALLAEGEMNVTTICEKLRLPQSSTSHHLSLLRIGGLVKTRRNGKEIFYSHADLTKHRLGKKSELTKRGSNAAKFGPVELVLPKM